MRAGHAAAEAPHQDVEDLRAHVQQFVRRFGLLVTRQTPCGFPVSPSYAHALMLLLRRSADGLTTFIRPGGGLGIDKSNVARLCERMVDAGHALQTVPPTDGRSRLVTLTPKGTRVAQRIEQGSRDRFSAVTTKIPGAKATHGHRRPGGPERGGGEHRNGRHP